MALALFHVLYSYFLRFFTSLILYRRRRLTLIVEQLSGLIGLIMRLETASGIVLDLAVLRLAFGHRPLTSTEAGPGGPQ